MNDYGSSIMIVAGLLKCLLRYTDFDTYLSTRVTLYLLRADFQPRHCFNVASPTLFPWIAHSQRSHGRVFGIHPAKIERDRLYFYLNRGSYSVRFLDVRIGFGFPLKCPLHVNDGGKTILRHELHRPFDRHRKLIRDLRVDCLDWR